MFVLSCCYQGTGIGNKGVGNKAELKRGKTLTIFTKNI